MIILNLCKSQHGEIELDSLVNHAYAEKLQLARRTPIPIHLGNNLTWYWKESQTHWPAHIRKPDGKVNNLALGSDDAFQILGSVIRNQLHKSSNRSEKWLHIKNRVEYHYISYQAAKGKDKYKSWAHVQLQEQDLDINQSLHCTLGLQKPLHFHKYLSKCL